MAHAMPAIRAVHRRVPPAVCLYCIGRRIRPSQPAACDVSMAGFLAPSVAPEAFRLGDRERWCWLSFSRSSCGEHPLVGWSA
jgi:hypothetical protein